jgi:uncharacterized membrane protein (UPF0127 family)
MTLLMNQVMKASYLRSKFPAPNLQKVWIRILAVTFVLLLHSAPSYADAVDLQIGLVNYQVELATTLSQRQQGLMHRTQLGPRQGMLLVYPGPGDRRIWMKNVLVTLWVYWIDENYTVLDKQRLQPCSAFPCPIFGTPGLAKYVLELGDYDHPLNPGDSIEGIMNL